MPKRAPIGVESFAELIDPDQDYLFADRTPFIKNIVVDAKVIAFHTFRRGGKSLLASMLQHFFSSEVAGVKTRDLFNALDIGKDKAFVEKHQGQYPVVMLSFKEVQENTFESAYSKMQSILQSAYGQHEYLLVSDKLSDNDRDIFNLYGKVTSTPKKEQLERALFELTRLLHKHHSKKVWVIIDEYDTPLTAAYRGNHLESMALFMKNFLSAGLKTNDYLEKSVMTGILRVSKESILSGLNNPAVYSVLNPGRYSPYFGFTDEEIGILFKEAKLTHDVHKVKQWYNGYQIGKQSLYNPWSIMKYIHQGGGEPMPFWANTANDSILQESLLRASTDIKAQFTALLAPGAKVTGELNEIIRFEDIDSDDRALWSLLLAAGYLTVEELHRHGLGYEGQLRIPNEEIRAVYVDIFNRWLERTAGGHLHYLNLLNTLKKGNVDEFTALVGDFLVTYASSYDLKQENSYHMLILGLVAALTYDYYLHSNIEAGLGRPDILLIPRESKHGPAIILEFKHTKDATKQEKEANEALAQIEDRNYAATLKKHPAVKQVLKIGLAFCEKSVISRSVLSDIVPIEIETVEKGKRKPEREAGDEKGKKKLELEHNSSSSSVPLPRSLSSSPRPESD